MDVNVQPVQEQPNPSQNKPNEFFSSERYLPVVFSPRKLSQWRLQQRMKTVSVLLTVCLNIGVDPPDVLKTSPCARTECWLDPHAFPPQKAIDQIGKALQVQYERWQPRARFKLCLDPDDESVKKFSISLRRNAKDERVLFHYNGHGVPRPTNNGEIWVFNKNFTQYIPLSLYELQSWVGSPAIYVFDCSAAGLIVHWFIKFADQHEQEDLKASKASPGPFAPDLGETTPGSPSTSFSLCAKKDHILLAACGSNEVLPSSSEYPADIFTACLTTPITMALKWFCTKTIITGISRDMIDKIPGRSSDRRTAMGELHWIFSAITDTIAWNVLPQKLFQKLFREDVLVASLFRNFLLAERIMRSCKCTPLSYPKLVPTYNHPMWAVWDLEADHCLAQLHHIVHDRDYEYKHSPFFSDQLTAFEVWLEFGSEEKKPPEQLPILLQVLLSQQHRQRALELLARFLDLGTWAVNLSLSVGIFPFILKLLQSPATELREVIVFIWAKILVVDKSCQFDLIRDNGQQYFTSVLGNTTIPTNQRIQAAFILSVLCNNCRPGQTACQSAKLLKACLVNIPFTDPLLRRWTVLCLGKLWENNEFGKKEALEEKAHAQISTLLTDHLPEVRAACVFALGTFFLKGPVSAENKDRALVELNLGLTLAGLVTDVSFLVRKELIIALSALISTYEDKFKEVEANAVKKEYRKRVAEVQRRPSNSIIDRQQSEGQKKLSLSQPNVFQQTVETQKKTSTSQPASTSSSVCSSPVSQSPNNKEPIKESADLNISKDAEDSEDDCSLYAHLWKVFQTLLTDPHPLLSKMVQRVVLRIRNEVKLDLQAAGIRLPADTRSKSASPGVGPRRGSLGFLSLSGNGKNFPLNQSQEIREADFKSTFYDWSCISFTQPLYQTEESELEVTPKTKEKKWRQQKATALIKELHQQVFQVKIQSLDHEIAVLENDNQIVSNLCFHPFEDSVFVSDEHDGIRIWNWKEGVQMHHFLNSNPTGTRITSLELLNEYDNSMLAVGSDDGAVRLWSYNNQNENKLKLVNAWKVLDDLPPARTGAPGLVLEWHKKMELLFASGTVEIIRVWDLNKEISIQDIPTESQSHVTCITSDQNEGTGNLIVTGFSDSIVRIFDKRIPNKYSLVSSISDYKGRIVNAFMPKNLSNQLICGSSHGEVKIWDLRQTKQPTKNIVAHNNPTVSTFTVHSNAPLFSIGTSDQRIRVMNFNGDEVSLMRFHDGFIGQRIGPVSALSFHPFKLLLGSGATDSIISIYTGETKKPQ